jgi:hypothetical protein
VALGRVFSQVLRFPLPIPILPNAPPSLIIRHYMVSTLTAQLNNQLNKIILKQIYWASKLDTPVMDVTYLFVRCVKISRRKIIYVKDLINIIISVSDPESGSLSISLRCSHCMYVAIDTLCLTTLTTVASALLNLPIHFR